MARFGFAYFLALIFALLISVVEAAPLVEKRQIGDIQCNIARLQTVGGLAKSGLAINHAIAAAGTDSAAVASLQTAQSGIQSADAGIKTIATALFTGQAAPAAARQQVVNGLAAATNALSAVSSTDTTLTSAISAAQSAVTDTTNAGQKVLSDCN